MCKKSFGQSTVAILGMLLTTKERKVTKIVGATCLAFVAIKSCYIHL